MAQRYDTYKDSGVQWLGEIPSHWGRCVISRILSGIQDGTHGSFQRTEIGRPLLSAKNIVDNGIYIGDNESLISEEDYYSIIKNGFPQKGDIAFCSVGSIGKCCIYEEDEVFAFQRSVTFLRVKKEVFNRYIFYYLKSAQSTKQFNAMLKKSAIGGIYMADIRRLQLSLPPLPEQHSIVTYLDDKCAKIDEWIEKKEKEVELLGEMKQRVIADAVTRGLNPNVKMKETGIAWLPEVPEHWDLLRNKTFLSLTDEKVEDRKDITLLSLTKQGVIIRDLSEGKGKFPKDFATYLVVRPNNLVFCLFDIDETPRTVGLVRNYGMLTGAYTNFEVNENVVLSEFAYFYYLQVDNVKGLKPYYTGLRKVVKTNTFLQLRMPVPPLAEQQEIVAYINDKTSKIDTLVAKVTKEIEHLKEYKQRLISDVVTGQIKVC